MQGLLLTVQSAMQRLFIDCNEGKHSKAPAVYLCVTVRDHYQSVLRDVNYTSAQSTTHVGGTETLCFACVSAQCAISILMILVLRVQGYMVCACAAAATAGCNSSRLCSEAAIVVLH
eukprot:20316-Heterococcus_DN1.PRE.2